MARVAALLSGGQCVMVLDSQVGVGMVWVVKRTSTSDPPMKNPPEIDRKTHCLCCLSVYRSYPLPDGELVKVQLARTIDSRWAVRAYTSESGTETVRGPFATQAAAEAAANRLDWQGY